MTSVTQFAQYLLRLDPHKSAARLALYNYVKHILEPSDPFTTRTIENFYAYALNFEQWQTNYQSLADVVRDDLAQYLKQAKVDDKVWKNIRHADSIQVLSLKYASDFEEIVATAESARRKSGERVKLLRISETELASLFLSGMGTLEVKVFSPTAIAVGSRLLPLAPLTHLHYASNMEFMPHVKQLLQGSLQTAISFYQDETGLNGLITRGHTFQKFETFVRARPNDNHDLFFCLKRIERCFINPQSDPYYQELVHSLQRAHRMLQNPESWTAGLPMAEKALQKGVLALRNAFPNDRLLQLLVTHLEYGIRQARTPNKNLESARPTE